jgi:hypothetical protein
MRSSHRFHPFHEPPRAERITIMMEGQPPSACEGHHAVKGIWQRSMARFLGAIRCFRCRKAAIDERRQWVATRRWRTAPFAKPTQATSISSHRVRRAACYQMGAELPNLGAGRSQCIGVSPIVTGDRNRRAGPNSVASMSSDQFPSQLAPRSP